MKRRILIGLALVVALPLLAIVGLFATREPPDGPRVEAGPSVVAVEAGGAYAWIVRTPGGAVLVDAGLDAKGDAILAALRSLGVEPDEVLAVLLTHGHPDHYAAAGLFPRAEILAGSGDLAMIRGETVHYAPFGKVVGALMPLPPGPAAITGLRGDEQLEFDGARSGWCATPGHSPGNVIYLYEDVLFSGDSLLRKRAASPSPPLVLGGLPRRTGPRSGRSSRWPSRRSPTVTPASRSAPGPSWLDSSRGPETGQKGQGDLEDRLAARRLSR